MILFLLPIVLAGLAQVNAPKECTILSVHEEKRELGGPALEVWISIERDVSTWEEFRVIVCRAVEQVGLPPSNSIKGRKISDYNNYRVNVYFRLPRFTARLEHRVGDEEGERASERYRGHYTRLDSGAGVAAFRPPGKPLTKFEVPADWCGTRQQDDRE